MKAIPAARTVIPSEKLGLNTARRKILVASWKISTSTDIRPMRSGRHGLRCADAEKNGQITVPRCQIKEAARTDLTCLCGLPFFKTRKNLFGSVLLGKPHFRQRMLAKLSF
jgi:hypothetical protein